MLQASIFWISTLTIWRRHSLSHLSLSSEAGGWIKFVSFTFFFHTQCFEDSDFFQKYPGVVRPKNFSLRQSRHVPDGF